MCIRRLWTVRSLGTLAHQNYIPTSGNPPSSSSHTIPIAGRSEGVYPLFSGRTLNLLHQHQHENLRQLRHLVYGSDLVNLPLYQIIARTHRDPSQARIAHFAGQAWNVDFFLQGLNNCINSTNEQGKPTDELRARLSVDFGSLEAMQDLFLESAMALVANGWVWLIRKPEGNLSIITTYDGGTPLFTNQRHPQHTVNTSNNNDSKASNPARSTVEHQASQPSGAESPWMAWASLFAASRKDRGTGVEDGISGGNRSTSLFNSTILPSTASTPATLTPVFGLSLWEHCYLLDYGLDRERYVNNFWKCINWNRASVILNLY